LRQTFAAVVAIGGIEQTYGDQHVWDGASSRNQQAYFAAASSSSCDGFLSHTHGSLQCGQLDLETAALLVELGPATGSQKSDRRKVYPRGRLKFTRSCHLLQHGAPSLLGQTSVRAHEHTPLPVSLGVPRWTDAHASRKAHLRDTAAALHTNEALGSLVALLVTPRFMSNRARDVSLVSIIHSIIRRVVWM